MEGSMETNVSSVKEAHTCMKSEEASQANNPVSLEDVPILTRESYSTWKDKMEKFLKKEGLWGYVDGTIGHPEDASKNQVIIIFREKCEAKTLPYIEELDTRFIWTQLVTMYDFTHPTNTDGEELSLMKVFTLAAGMKMRSTRYTWCLPFYRAIVDGDWKTVSQFLSRNTGALTAILTTEGELPLHVAVQKGQVNLAKELIKIMSAEDLSKQRKYGRTALHIAASDGNIEIVKAIVEMDEKLAIIPSLSDSNTPIDLAAFASQKDVVHYLYPIAIRQEVYPGEHEKARATILTSLIIGDFHGLALDLLQKYPSLVLTGDKYGNTAMDALSTKPSAFQSSFPTKRSGGGMLGYYFEIFMGSLLDVHLDAKNACWHTRGDVENSFAPDGDSTEGRNIKCGSTNCIIFQFWKGLSLCFRGLFQNALIKLVPGCKSIYDEKLKHYEASELLKEVWSLISELDHDSYVAENVVVRAMSRAIQNGIVEFMEETINNWPRLLFRPLPHGSQLPFHFAISNRQEKIFGLIHRLGPMKYEFTRFTDRSQNLMLHQAAKKAPIQRLNQVSGAALQMQRELLWYKEVESIMSSSVMSWNYETYENNNHETPRLLFTEEHKDLLKDGATWMKDTATQCMVVATLIATIMFAAVFTVPGSNDQSDNTGEFNYIHGKFPIIFVISNVLALCSSVASVLMFLAIITSRYAEEDFLRTLPQMLTMGLLFLFISIVGMMIAFVAAVLVMLRSNVLWVSFPIIFVASIPIIIYALVELPLFIQLIFTTSSSDVFGKRN